MTDPITFRDLLRLMARGFVFKFGNSPEAEQVEDALRRAADTIDGLRDRVVLAEEAREKSLGDVRYLVAKLELADAVVEAIGVHMDDYIWPSDVHDALAAYRAEVKP